MLREILPQYSFEGDPAVTIRWTTLDEDVALAEGWYLDHGDGAVMPDPDAAGDAPARAYPTAWDYVCHRATEGSEMHIRAMIYHAWSSVGCWEKRFRESSEERSGVA